MKPKVRYQMNFSGKWLTASAFFAGLSLFLCVMHYYVLGNIETVQGGAFVLQVLMPMILLGLYILLVKLVKLDIPLVYCGFLVLHCLYLCLARLSGGPVWLNVVEIILYVLCCGGMIAAGLGFFPGKWYAAAGFFLVAAARFFFRNVMGYWPDRLLEAIPEVYTLSSILCLGCLCGGLKRMPVRKRITERA